MLIVFDWNTHSSDLDLHRGRTLKHAKSFVNRFSVWSFSNNSAFFPEIVWELICSFWRPLANTCIKYCRSVFVKENCMLVHIFADIVWVSLWIGNWLAFFSHQNLFGMAIGTETIWIPLGYNIESLSHCPSEKVKLASRMAKVSTFLRVGFYSCGKRLLKRIGYESFTSLIKRGRFQLETWWVISATSTRWTIKDILFPSHKNITQVISCRLETGPATHPYHRLETLGRLSQSDNCQNFLPKPLNGLQLPHNFECLSEDIPEEDLSR